jgi:uncharacterized protein (TIGR02246 family)
MLRQAAASWLVIIALGTRAVASEGRDDKAFIEALQALEAVQIAAYNAHNAAALASIFVENGVSLTPGGVISGRAAIETYLGGLMKEQDWRDYEESVDEAHLLAADAGWARGHWSATTRTPAGETVLRQGLWSAVYVWDEGTWRMRMDTINLVRGPTARK